MKRIILVYGDQELFCHLLGSFLHENGFSISKQSTDIWETIEEIRRNPPHVILIDARRSKSNGLDDATLIKGEFPLQKIVLLSASSEAKDVMAALNLGIDGYLLKSVSPGELLQDLAAVCTGELRVSRELVGLLVRDWRKRKRTGGELEEQNSARLTLRENQIMVLMAQGNTNKEIAEKLELSPNTVKNHVISILGKFNVHTRTGAVSKWKNLLDEMYPRI